MTETGLLIIIIKPGPFFILFFNNVKLSLKTTSSAEKKWNYMFEVMDSLIFLLLSSISALLSKRRKLNKVFLCSCDQWH